MKACLNCGNPFEVMKGGFERFCSPKCYVDYSGLLDFMHKLSILGKRYELDWKREK